MSGRCGSTGWVLRKSGTQRGMWPFTVVMRHPIRQHRSKMPLVERNDPIQTLTSYRPNEAFTMRIRLRGTYWRLQDVWRRECQTELQTEFRRDALLAQVRFLVAISAMSRWTSVGMRG